MRQSNWLSCSYCYQCISIQNGGSFSFLRSFGCDVLDITSIMILLKTTSLFAQNLYLFDLIFMYNFDFQNQCYINIFFSNILRKLKPILKIAEI